jgi:hypothetical protein
MAAVTLKDLMNPLTKIEDYTNQTSQKLDTLITLFAKNGTGTEATSQSSGKSINKESAQAISILGSGLLPLIDALDKLDTVSANSIETLTEVIAGVGESLLSIKDPEAALKNASIIEIIGNNVLAFAIGLAMATPLLILSLPGAYALGLSINIVFSAIGNIGDVSQKIQAIDILSKSALSYSIAMSLTAVLAPLVIVGALAFGFSVRLLTFAMGTAEANVKLIDSLKFLGLGVISFVIGMAVTAYYGMDVLKGTLLLTGSLIVLSVGLRIAGNKTTTKGILGLALIGPAMLIFALSLSLTSQIIGQDYESYMAPLLVIGGASLLFYAIGKGATQIAIGSLALAAIGLSLLVFNLGYVPFAKTANSLTAENLLTQGSVLAMFGIGAVALGAGIAAAGGTAFLAPLLYAAAGISLISLAAGLNAMKGVDFKEDDAKNLTYTLGAVAMAFSGVNPEDGFFANVGNMFSRVVQSGVGIAAAGLYTAAGIALITLSKGLTAFKAIKFTEEDSKELAISLSAVTTGFALAGGAEQVPSTSFFGQMFGFKANVVNEGIRAVSGAGRALKDVANGLIAFQSLIDQNINFGTPDANGKYEEGTLGYAIVNTLGFIQSAFSAIGSAGTQDATGLWGALGFKQNVVAAGIGAVRGTGAELKGIADGLKTFLEFTNQNIDFSPEGPLAMSIVNTLGFIQSAFSAIGSQGTQDATGLWGALGFKENVVAAGVKAVRGAGTELTNIANGLKTFQGLVEKEIDFSPGGSLAQAVSKSITFVGEAFAAIGGNRQKTGWFVFKWDQNKVNAGIKAVKGAGTELTNIATGLTKFDGIQDAEALGQKISTLFTSMGSAFTSLYEKDPKINDKMSKVATFVTQVGNQATKGALEKAADGFQGIADAINSVELDKANAMGDLFKGASKLSSDAKAYKKLAEVVEEIRDILSGEKEPTAGGGFMGSIQGAVTNAVTSVTGTTAPQAATAIGGKTQTPQGQATDARLLAALERINSTMANLPSAIAAIEIKVRD